MGERPRQDCLRQIIAIDRDFLTVVVDLESKTPPVCYLYSIDVRVSDNGYGLKEGDEARIFEQFQKGQKLRSDRSGGTELGLAICRGIIQAHGGMIYAKNNKTLDSRDGSRAPNGASFIFTLPICISPERLCSCLTPPVCSRSEMKATSASSCAPVLARMA